MTETAVETPITQFPAPRENAFHPPSAYLRLSREHPVHRVTLPSGLPAVLVTRYNDVRRLLDDNRMSADERLPGYPHLYEGAFESPLTGTFMRTDGEEHHRVRRMLSKDFTVRRAAELRPEVEAIVSDCLDAMEQAGPPADIVEALAFPTPSRTICHILGVPYEDRGIFEANTRAMITTTSTQHQVQEAMIAIVRYLDQLITAKEAEPADDLISRLVIEGLKPGNLGRQEMIQITLILLVGGHETTSAMIGLGTFALLEHRDQLDELAADPSLWPRAIDELLRHQTIVQHPVQRVALEDIEVEGETIRAGEGVLFVLDAANRDPEAFPDPHVLDVHRNARQHVAMSSGPHQCLGQALARVELEVALRTLFQRLPTLQLAVTAEEVPLRPGNVGLHGVESLPVRW